MSSLKYYCLNLQLTKEDFAENEILESLILGHNRVPALNNSLLNLKSLNFLNITMNRLTEFSFQEIVGLQELKSIDLSYNQIRTLVGPATVNKYEKIFKQISIFLLCVESS